MFAKTHLWEMVLGATAASVVAFGGSVLLLMLKVAAFVRQRNKIEEDHPANANMKQRIGGACLDVLLNIAVHRLIDRLLALSAIRIACPETKRANRLLEIENTAENPRHTFSSDSFPE
ncbi:hypothetical protein HPP92_021565 [Vanilla planifolia]|uniref:Uncharacterized protein n=1 Tax=Vanilla planifolia TaxID=51239 RepID=A0A835UHA8_VANPL|nr:hypothetical protein HPP92_021565 [Vanilla planifolia]